MSDQILVRGGEGLRGHVQISGSKNSTLAVMAACLLAHGEVLLRRVPDIGDIETMVQMLRNLGVRVSRDGDTLAIDPTGFSKSNAPDDLVRRMRASFYVLGPMLARWGQARAALPGGCDIGSRPVDFHTKGLQQLGAVVEIKHGHVEAHTRGLTGGRIYLDFPSCGATLHLMTTASLARGVTTIENAATEPEVVDLANFLIAMGAQIHGYGTPTLTIQGVERLQPVEYAIMPDRIEAGTFAIASAISGGDVTLRGVAPDHLQPVILKLQEMGASITSKMAIDPFDNELRVSAPRRLSAVDILAMPHPGFPTDLQQPMVALLSISDGSSLVTDRVFENRFKFVAELQRLGADIRLESRTAFIRGVDHLTGAEVRATDLRAGATLILAGLAAEGETEIADIEHVDRGYERIVDKLRGLGADIERHSTAETPAPAGVAS